MGDLALHVAEDARRARRPAREVCADFAEMGRLAVAMARKAAEVARTRNVLARRGAHRRRRRHGRLHRHMFAVLIDPAWPTACPAAVDLTLLARYYERYADHAVLVAREIVYAVTGQEPGRDRCEQGL